MEWASCGHRPLSTMEIHKRLLFEPRAGALLAMCVSERDLHVVRRLSSPWVGFRIAKR